MLCEKKSRPPHLGKTSCFRLHLFGCPVQWRLGQKVSEYPGERATKNLVPVTGKSSPSPCARNNKVRGMQRHPNGADTPPPTGRSDGSPRAATAPSSGWLQCVFNGCRHTSQDGQFHRPPRRPDRSMSLSAARHTQTGRPVQLAPSVVVCPQPKPQPHVEPFWIANVSLFCFEKRSCHEHTIGSKTLQWRSCNVSRTP